MMPVRSGVLYVRASLRPFAAEIREKGGVREFLASHFPHEELLAPYFLRARPFWERPATGGQPTNSGALGKELAKYAGAVFSAHPSHRFVGFGGRVEKVLRAHDQSQACFYPVRALAAGADFSMLLLACCEESPGFSTVHATQYQLGLSQKHLFRHLLRWDIAGPDGMTSVRPPESPGCSLSFGKFYAAYEADGNLVRGVLQGQQYLLVPSAARALQVEERILAGNPRFVDCGRFGCSTCSLRLY